MRISRDATRDAKTAFTVDGTNLGPEVDSELQDLINDFRKALVLHKNDTLSKDSEKAIMIGALIPIKNAILEHGGGSAMALDIDAWASMCWDFYLAACNNTQAGQVCKELNDNEAMWHDMTFSLLEEHVKRTTRSSGPWWSERRAITLMLFFMSLAGMMILYSMSSIDEGLSGRSKLYGAGASTTGLIFSDVWRRFGPQHLFGETIDEVETISPGLPAVAPAPQVGGIDVRSVSSNSEKIQRENEELRKRLDALEGQSRKDESVPLPAPNEPPPSQELDALRSFASGASVQGPISMTAAKHAGHVPPLSSSDGGARVLRPVGSLVTIHGLLEHEFLNGLPGEVIAHSDDGRHHVLLADGSKAEYMRACNLRIGADSTATASSSNEAHVKVPEEASCTVGIHQGLEQVNPFVQGKQAATTANQLIASLDFWNSISGHVPNSHTNFWSTVSSLEEKGHLPVGIKAILAGHGYVGASTRSPPRVVELKKQLEAFSRGCMPSAGTGANLIAGFIEGAMKDSTASKLAATSDSVENLSLWHSQLPPDHKFAGPEIYRSIRAGGHDSVRAYVNSFFDDNQKTSPEFLEWSTLASMVDFRLAKEPSATAVLAALASDDQLEIPLRKIAAGVHLKRTGDREGAASMLAVSSRKGDDIAPTWLVAEAATYSTSEWKRKERGRARPSGPAPSGGGGGGGGGAARGKGGGAKGGGGKGGRGPKKPHGGGGPPAVQG